MGHIPNEISRLSYHFLNESFSGNRGALIRGRRSFNFWFSKGGALLSIGALSSKYGIVKSRLSFVKFYIKSFHFFRN